jgi:hypothetical protein
VKIIEAMKKIKELDEKAKDLREKVAKHSVDMDFETPLYPDQRATVDGWLQAHSDILKEMLRLKVAIQRTNLATVVAIDVAGDGKDLVKKTIAEWIHRRTKLADIEGLMWAGLTDRNLREGTVMQTSGTPKDVKIRRYYDPKQRDEKITLFKAEPLRIDATLEVTNAITDLIES